MPRMSAVTPHPGKKHPELLLTSWCQHLYACDHAVGTIKKYTQAVSAFLVWYHREEGVPLQLAALTPGDLMNYRSDLQQVQHKSISTINLRISALRAWCAWLVDEGFLPSDPATRLKVMSGGSASTREGLSSIQVDALLRQTQVSRDPVRNYAIVQLLLQTGIRLGECSSLTFGDLSIGERSGVLVVRAGKGHHLRAVPLTRSVCDAIAILVAPRLGVEPPSIKAVAARWPESSSLQAVAPIFLSQKGGALTRSAMGQMIADLVKAAGTLVPIRTNAHTLRHTFARQYLAQYPGDVVGVATLLGHRSLDTTRYYCQLDVSQVVLRLERLGRNTGAEE